MTSFLDRVGPSKQKREPAPTKTTTSTTPYGRAVLDNQCERMRTTPEGSRDDTMTRIGRLLGGFVGGGEIAYEDAHNQLRSAAVDSGLTEREAAKIPRFLEHGATEPIAAPQNWEPGQAVVVPPDARVAVPAARASQFRSRFLSPTDISNLPEPEPLIDGVLNRGSTALLYGKWGTSKSFIALDWACSLAAGRAWQGRRTEKVKVLYVVAEGVSGFAARLDAWKTAWHTTLDDRSITFLPVPVNLMTQDADLLAAEVETSGFEFIVFDTLARCTVGAEENSARDVGIVIDSMTRIMDATPNHRGVVLGVHHTGKDAKTLRGSSAYEGGVDTVYFVERDHNITLRCQKQKDGPDTDRHVLRLAQVEGTDSCVVEAVSGDAAEKDAAAVALLKKIFLEMFSETGVSNSDLRAVAAEHGMSQSSFYRARGELIKDRWIVSSGSAARGFFELSKGVT